jgi:hypothetical protein
MGRSARRLRGVLLRIVLSGRPGIAIGIALLAPSMVLWLGDYQWETWYTDGLALILGATGAALIVAAIAGRRPDWIDRG